MLFYERRDMPWQCHLDTKQRAYVMFCKFKRHEKSSWETGIMINEDKVIIDMDGDVVIYTVYNYKIYPARGAMIVNARKFE